MGKDYLDDPIKKKARHEIYRFVDKVLPSDRTQATALYLASTNEEESKLLDSLGIVRANRVILEGDQSKVRAVEKANPGVRVLPLTTTQFFSEEARRYAPLLYCGLDYECTLNESVERDLELIAKGNCLADGGIIYTNLVGNREKKPQKARYMERFLRFAPNESLLKELLGADCNFWDYITRCGEQLFKDYESRVGSDKKPIGQAEFDEITAEIERRAIELLPEDKLAKLRSFAVYQTVTNLLRHEPFNVIFNNKLCPGSGAILIREGNELTESARKLYASFSQGNIAGQRVSTLLESILEDAERAGTAVRTLGRRLEENAALYFERGNLSLIPLMFRNLFSSGYVSSDSRSFNYISNKNTLMLLDIINVKKINPDVKSVYEALVQQDKFIYYSNDRPYLAREGILDFHPTREGIVRALREESQRASQWLKRRINFLKSIDDMRPRSLVHIRRNLGSAYAQPLNLATARKAVIEGLTDEEIEKRYHVGNWRMVASLRAHKTRGTFHEDKQGRTLPQPVEKIADSHQRAAIPTRLISREVYRELPDTLKLRIDYFEEEVFNKLPKKVRRQVVDSFRNGVERLLAKGIPEIRGYAFFDDLSLALRKRRGLDSRWILQKYIEIRDAQTLTPLVVYPAQSSLVEDRDKPDRKTASRMVKEEVRELVRSGLPIEEIWGAYQSNFSSRREFGATIAWASPTLAYKRKTKN
jgi:hypothetical protein